MSIKRKHIITKVHSLFTYDTNYNETVPHKVPQNIINSTISKKMKCVLGGSARHPKMSSLYLGSELPTLTPPPATAGTERAAAAEDHRETGAWVSFIYEMS